MRGSFEWHKKTQTEVSDKLKIAEEHSLVCSGLCFDNSINIFFQIVLERVTFRPRLDSETCFDFTVHSHAISYEGISTRSRFQEEDKVNLKVSYSNAIL